MPDAHSETSSSRSGGAPGTHRKDALGTPREGALGNNLVTWLLAFAFLAKLGFDCWALDRGFEMGDEGTFLLNLNDPENASPPFEFYRLLGAFVDGPWIGVVGARALRIAAELAGSLALVAGAFSWARRRVFPPGVVDFAPFLALCLLGTLLGIASRSFGYNDATNLCVYAALGCFFALASLNGDASAWWRRTLLAAAIGILCGIQLWVKFPPALLWVVVIAAAVGLGFRWLPARERGRLCAVHLAAFALGAWLVIWIAGGLGPLMPRLAIAAVLPGLTGYHPAEILVRYALYDFGTALDALLFAATFGVAAWVSVRVARLSLDAALSAGLVLAAVVVSLSVARSHPHFLHPSVVNLAAAAVGLSLALSALRVASDRRAQVWVPLLVLLAAPWIQIIGTNVTLTMRLPSHALPLFVVVAVAVFDLRERSRCSHFHRVVSLLAVGLTSWVFVTHHVFEPYGLRAAIHKQEYEVEALGDVRVDIATRNFLAAVEGAFVEAGYEEGDPIVALDYMPGLVFFLGGTSPGFNFYMFRSEELNCFNLNRADFAEPPFLILGRPMSEAQRGCIEAFAFPGDFRLLRTLQFPYEGVYRGFGERGLSHVYLYGPVGEPDSPSDRTLAR